MNLKVSVQNAKLNMMMVDMCMCSMQMYFCAVPPDKSIVPS